MSLKLLPEFHANRDQSDLSILNYSFGSCSQLLNLTKSHFLSRHCIAYAFGKLGCINVHSHGNSVLIPYFSCLVMMLSHNQRCHDGN
jgi:hypothetical protein